MEAMQYLGQFLVLASFFFTALTLTCASVGAARGRAQLVRAAGLGMRATAWLNVAASLVLLHAIVTHDFSNRYVASYTDSSMPLFYLVTAFWGGEKGALLFFALVLSLLAAALARSRNDASPYTGVVLGTVAAALLFFDVLMVFASSPFETLPSPPLDGSGLNPLLMNPLMALHPPVQLAGFVAYTIPFAFGLAALVKGGADTRWVLEARPWYLLAWGLLTAGLVLGGLWAYLELGWGGFWGWDPVENAALLPWLSGTAMLHTAALEHRRGMLRRTNFMLTFLTFILTIFAIFLTRSQLIHSLHSFENSVLTPYFLWYLVGLLVACTMALALRWRHIKAPQIAAVWSREAVVVANAMVFMVSLFVVLWGTLLPRLSESSIVRALFGIGQALEVGPDWFNRMLLPIGVVLLLLTALGPLMPYRKATGRSNRRLLVTAGTAVGLVGMVLLLLWWGLPVELEWPGAQGWPGLMMLFGAAWVVAGAAADWWRAAGGRAGVTGEGHFNAALRLLSANSRRFGGHLAHLGVALFCAGAVGGLVKVEEKDVILDRMEHAEVGSTRLVFLGTDTTYHADGEYVSLASRIAAWPQGEDVPQETVQRLKETSKAVEAIRGEVPPEVILTFRTEAEAREFLVQSFMRTTRDLDVVAADQKSHEVQLGLRTMEALGVVPKAFHRLVAELRWLEQAVGKEYLTVTAVRGEPAITVRAVDDGLFRALTAPPGGVDIAGVRPVSGRPLEVAVLPAGLGTVLSPEVRFYARSGQSTTEVDIETGPLADLYVAANPADGSRSTSLTAMVNPLMWGVWVGAVLMMAAAAVGISARTSAKGPPVRVS